MSESRGYWWMDAGARWHQGDPPPEWWQAPDGRWHPPGADDPTEEATADPPTGPAHLARGEDGGTSVGEGDRHWPRWAQLAGPVAGIVLAVAVLGAAAVDGLRGDDPADLATVMTTTTTELSTATSSRAAMATPTNPTDPTVGASTTTEAWAPGTTGSVPPDPSPTPTTAAEPPPTPSTSVPTNSDIHPGASCSPEGATAVSADGVPVTCTRQKCHGAPFSEPRWRRTEC